MLYRALKRDWRRSAKLLSLEEWALSMLDPIDLRKWLEASMFLIDSRQQCLDEAARVLFVALLLKTNLARVSQKYTSQVDPDLLQLRRTTIIVSFNGRTQWDPYQVLDRCVRTGQRSARAAKLNLNQMTCAWEWVHPQIARACQTTDFNKNKP